MQCHEIRHSFVAYYRRLGFRVLPRAPILHDSVPMSFVMSAGLVQIETALAQLTERTNNQYVLVQECFRHFDIEKVGTDVYHLSLFEMPGAFRFGVGGQTAVIEQMWQLATGVLRIPPDRIWISYFDGGTYSGHTLAADERTFTTWRQLGVPPHRLVGLGLEGNYWRQSGILSGDGQPRKCGPHTEMFYDRGASLTCSAECRPGCACGRFMEFANTLFISHHYDPKTNELIPLAEPFTETVIGTERVATISQHAASVFDIESYRPIIECIRQCTPANHLPENLRTACEQVIADHLRALYVLVADGAPPPGKDGRERIVKRLIRGVLTRQILLGMDSQEFLPAALRQISCSFADSELAPASPDATLLDYFAAETARFSRTIKQGQRQLRQFVRRDRRQLLAGHEVVFFEKQCGLPRPLLDTLIEQEGASFSEAEYRSALGRWSAVPHH